MHHSDPDYPLFRSLLQIISFLAPPKRKPKYSDKLYLSLFWYILRSGCSLRDACSHPLNSKRIHPSTLCRKFNSWARAQVFTVFYQHLSAEYQSKFMRDPHFELYVDSTNIRNKNGEHWLGPNAQDKYKNGNKITCVIDADRFPLYRQIDPANDSDATIVLDVIAAFDQNTVLAPEISLDLVGDKGYVKNANDVKPKKRIIKLIHPYRRNQKVKINGKRTKERLRNTEAEKEALRRRSLIENVFANFKQAKKIERRYEKRMIMYQAYVDLALIILGSRVIKKKIEQKKEERRKKKEERRKK